MADSRGTGEAEDSGETASVDPGAVLASPVAVPGLAGIERTLWPRFEPDAPDRIVHLRLGHAACAESAPVLIRALGDVVEGAP
ncbi:MAG: hypothetical protein NXI30_11455 [bacterium]|nr:hypothetical protein [bacterium]